MSKNKVEFEVEVGGKTLKLAAVRPSVTVSRKADIIRSARWGVYAQTEGVLLESQLRDVIRKKGLWDDEKQKHLDTLDKRILDSESLLPDEKGRVRSKGVTLSRAREAALQMRTDRVSRMLLLSDFSKHRAQTAEAQSEEDRFRYLTAECVVHADTGKPYFESVDDYLNRMDDPDVVKAAQTFAEFYFGHDPEWETKTPEMAFLIRYKMVDPKTFALLGKDGKPLDEKVDALPTAAEQAGDTFDLEADEWSAPSE